MKKRHGLSAQFTLLLLAGSLISVVVFAGLQIVGNTLMANYFEMSDFQARCVEQRIISFQEYVNEHGLTANDRSQITDWAKKQPLLLMEIYRDNILIYTSSAPENSNLGQNDVESPYYEWLSYYIVSFADGNADVVIHSDDEYHWYTYAMVAEIIVCFLLFLVIFLKGSRSIVTYICQLSSEIQALEGGDLDFPITIQGNTELTDLAKSLNSMRLAFKEQREQEAASFRANQTMITEMSHDLRTPLTTLLIYTEIVRYKKYENEAELNNYLQRIDAKACQIKQLSDHIFEYSLISKNHIIQLDDPKPFREIFHDVLSEAVSYLGQRGFCFDLELDWDTSQISVYPQYVKRLVDNVASNLVKYADSSARIRIAVTQNDAVICLSFANKIRHGPTEQDGAQIGLTNMRTMMEKMNGQCLIHQTVQDFKVELKFPKC